MKKDPDFKSQKKGEKRLDLAAKSRFASVVSDQTMAVMSNGYIPLNVQKNTDWAVKCFREWVSSRTYMYLKEINACVL